MATENMIQKSKLALPYLVLYAQKRKTLTYSELGDKIGTHPRVVPQILGYLRDEICRPRGLPLINVITVNKATQMPGRSFLPEGTEGLTDEEYKKAFEEIRDDIFAYDGWDDLLEELDLDPIEKNPNDFNEEGRAYLKILKKRKTEAEGPNHLKLKNYVALHPECLNLNTKMTGKTEFLFLSGDECDVVFDLDDDNAVVVEIKNGERGELVKGIYQAIKYRALMIAQKGQGKDCDVAAFLVAYTVPDDIVEFAKKFDIECKIITHEMMD